VQQGFGLKSAQQGFDLTSKQPDLFWMGVKDVVAPSLCGTAESLSVRRGAECRVDELSSDGPS